MSLRVGRIPFLVCAPFFHDFLGREGEYREFDFVDGPPSAHCAGLMDGSIDLSPASSITFALKPGAFVLSPSLCTSCSFEVRSVKLFSRYPIESLGGRTVRITSQSRTSVALLRILLEMRYGLKPAYVQGFAAEDGDDACLLIGDMAAFRIRLRLGLPMAGMAGAPVRVRRMDNLEGRRAKKPRGP